MMILLMIGKIIGIILLVAAIIIAVILLVPMRYRFVAESEDKHADFVLNWLFGLVHFRAGYHEHFDYGLRVAGIRVFPREKKKKEKKKSEAGTEAADEKEKEKPPLKERIGKVLQVIKSFHEQGVAAALFPELQKFLVRIRPRKIAGDVAFGFEDPATTGRVCGGMALVPYLFSTDLSLTPDFETEESYLDGNVRARGHIFIIHVILFLLVVFKKKEIRRFMHVIRANNKKKSKKD